MSSESLYPIEFTGDGSPTLRHGQGETMHNREGAFSESLYIYLEAMTECLRQPGPHHILSVGLGLGYNEMLWAALSERHDLGAQDWQLTSFESDFLLRKSFLNWICGYQPPLTDTYEQIAIRVAANFDMSEQRLREKLGSAVENKSLQLLGSLDLTHIPSQRYRCILYDAYSSHTSPELWNEEFIFKLIDNVAAKNCLFSTYAAKGDLKRALLRQNFQLKMRSGFGGKRQSTWAQRD